PQIDTNGWGADVPSATDFITLLLSCDEWHPPTRLNNHSEFCDPAVDRVLFRLTTTPDVATDRGLNQDIIRYNNTQNAIKISDFRSNDPLQQFLERELQQNRVRGPLPPFYYIRKRGAARRGTGFGVRLEDFAKMRYSYLYEPTLVHAAPKQLWTIDGDEGAGAYPKAFGIDGVIHDIWTTPQVDEGRLVIALHQHFVTEAKAAAQRDEGLRFLHRARFHSLALAGAYARELRDPLPDISSLAHSRPAFQSFVDEFALAARMTLIFAVQHYLDNGTLFAFVRSTEQWTSLLRDFKLQLHAQS
ncbi:MAG: AIPR family protein, partial [Acidimicrobiales bacterium]